MTGRRSTSEDDLFFEFALDRERDQPAMPNLLSPRKIASPFTSSTAFTRRPASNLGTPERVYAHRTPVKMRPPAGRGGRGGACPPRATFPEPRANLSIRRKKKSERTRVLGGVRERARSRWTRRRARVATRRASSCARDDADAIARVVRAPSDLAARRSNPPPRRRLTE